MRLVLIGPPGSGKGTQAERLVRRFGAAHISTGDLFRDAIRRGTPPGLVAGPLISRGRLAPDALVNEVVAEVFRRPDRPDRFVMDGYPRTYPQAVAFDALLAQEFLNLTAVVELAAGDDAVVARVGGRRCCTTPGCGLCYHLEFLPPRVPGTCDRCGGPLALRDDDREEVVRRRLAEYRGVTTPLLAHYRARGLLHTVPALDPPDVVHANIVGALPPE